MATRFTYSRWDGTQKGFDLDADALIDEITDDLLYHGDLNAALRRLMQQGMKDRNGEQIQGLRELMREAAPAAPGAARAATSSAACSTRSPTQLDEIVDEERHAIENATAEAERSGDQRRAEHAREAAAERHMQLDLLPPDLAGQVRELRQYDFDIGRGPAALRGADGEAARAAHAAVRSTRCREGMQNMSPEQMARMKDMMAAPQRDARASASAARTPASSSSWRSSATSSPRTPQTLDELLENMAERMAAMQAMMNSMTPEQRAQLQELSEQLMDDMDLRWQVDQLGQQPAARCSRSMGWEQQLRLRRARTRWASARPCR